jgi:type IV pilus assembly protein PilW
MDIQESISHLRHRNDNPAARLLSSARGLTLVELMVTLVVVLVVIAAASTAYVQLFGSFKVQSKITDTQMDTLCGLELLRYDVEMAGYGLPFDMNSLTYTEATAAPANAYNDVPNVPRPFVFGDHNGTNSSDVLVIKSIVANLNSTTKKWSLMYMEGGSCKVRNWGSTDLSFVHNERVIVLDDEARRLLPQPSSTNWKLTYDNNCTGLPNPTVGINIVYGINTDSDPSMPFNRVDYYLDTPDALPGRCLPGSFVLYRATINQSGGARNPQPLIDCVMNFQVAFGLDTNGDGGVDAWTSGLTLTAAQIRSRVRELRIFLLYHEGGRDDRFRFSGTLTLGDAQTGALSTYTPAGDAARYRWKVAKAVIKPMNLDASGP